MASMFGLAVSFTVLLTVILVGYHILVTAISESQDEDERDRLAGSTGGIVLGLGVISIVLMVIAGGMSGDPYWQQPVIIANALMLAVFVSVIVELALTIWFHRRGV